MDDRRQRLREARVAKGFETAAAAADAFGWNRNTYASNENGNAPFSYRKAKEYAAALGVRPEWLYDAAGPMRPTPEPGYVAIVGILTAAGLGAPISEDLTLLLGGALGLALAAVVVAVIKSGDTPVPLVSIGGGIWVEGLGLTLLIGLLVGVLPALRGMRLRIVDALAGR